MAILSRRSKILAPRLSPELDDQVLAKTCKVISVPVRGNYQVDHYIAVVEELLQECDTDHDRRAFRFEVIARQAENVARHWRRHSPNEPDALVLSALARLASAREAGAVGGGAPAYLTAALDDCHTAAALNQADSMPWIAALAIMRQQRRPWPDVQPVWNELRARDPWSRAGHLELLGYLSPDECGSQTAVRDFVNAVTEAAPPASPVAALPLEAELRRYRRTLDAGGAGAITADEAFRQPAVAALLDRARVEWLQPGAFKHAAAIADLNLLAYALLRTGYPQNAAPVFQRLGGVVTAWPWSIDGDPVERFTLWNQRFAG
ncbi:hypothetical protein KDK95_22860 [Actinospica sp. MGRD01-02]|uniref:Uncharacterized protein n=1 Tax=Actinospica acidithermotolerans TaxID=2828514 RepID=A0A941IKQ1_9ACTN|nr:hypothetical protein [Actinospica acidithermotolerans]MBR7829167.1 hypothetical protein [Actinospica acidithermotolerans]